ncbi:DUF4142 domain-containing protein [soil metagenome]
MNCNIPLKTPLVSACMVVLLATGSVAEALDSASTEPASMRLASDDRAFIKQAAGAGLYEVEASKLAAQRAQSPQVRKFAQMLVQQHTAANTQLKSLAEDKSYTFPIEMPSGKRSTLAALSQSHGAAFDAAYVEQVGIKDHKTDIEHFETAARSAKDPDLKAWAGKTLPSLKEHLAAAQALETSVSAARKP